MDKPRKKMGRPLISNKPVIKISITLDENSMEILTKYSIQENKSKSEVIRELIKKLKDKLE